MPSSNLRIKLLEASAGLSNSSKQDKSRKRLRIAASPRVYARSTSIGSVEAAKPNRGLNTSDPSGALRRRFLLRLAVALHNYGSSASRTEYLIERAADRLHVETNVAVFPSVIFICFLGDEHDSTRTESHLVTVESELDVAKLGKADELASDVGKDEPLILSYLRLKAIALSPPEFGKWWCLFSSALSAATVAPLFFEGSFQDAGFSFFLGLIVGALNMLAWKSSLYKSVNEFVAAVVVSFLARLLTLYLKELRICYSSVTLSALVDLLPGMSLTLGVSEMVSKAHITGTSRIMQSLFSALQLGFGLDIGGSLVWWTKEPASTCSPSDVSIWWKPLWFTGYTIAANILVNAKLGQWPGMVLAAGVGYIVSEITDSKLGSNASTVLASFAVGITGTSYSYFTGDLPLAMILSGVLLLVPSGIGAAGLASMFSDDLSSGMSFVFNMVAAALSITLGLLISKIVLPTGLFGTAKFTASQSTLATQLEEDTSDAEQEDMAI